MKSRPSLRFLHPLILPFALFVSGCEVIDRTVTPIFMMTPQQELELGRKMQLEIGKTMRFVNDPFVVDYVRKVGGIVIANAPHQASMPTQFYVVKNDEINAFAIPGGNMYIQTGLLNAAQDEAELAAVIAHEYGHVVYRHAAKHVSRRTGINMIEQIVFANQSAQTAKALGDLVSEGVMTRYSREDELEADSIAIPTLYHAGYDPNALVTFFQTLQASSESSNRSLNFFSSHPPTGDRINRARGLVATLPAKQTVRPITELRAVQARLIDLGVGRR